MTQKKQPKRKNKASWIDLIKYIINFLFNRNKDIKAQREEQIQEESEKLEETYEKIDSKSQKQKDKSTKERLENLF